MVNVCSSARQRLVGWSERPIWTNFTYIGRLEEPSKAFERRGRVESQDDLPCLRGI